MINAGVQAALPSMRGRSLLYILRKLGLTNGLKLVLDAGDAASYASGQPWLDLSGNGYDFNRGSGSGSDGADPTFNGTAGRLSSGEYFSFDGGDYLTYDSANETWMQNLHKDNAKVSALAAVYGADIGTTLQGLFGTGGGSSSNVGFEWTISASGNLQISVRNGSGSVALQQTSSGASLQPVNGAWNIIGFSLDEAVGTGGINWMTNGNFDTDVSTYSSPSALAATYTAQIGARGNANSPLVSTSRSALFAMWESVALTPEQFAAIFRAARGRLVI